MGALRWYAGTAAGLSLILGCSQKDVSFSERPCAQVVKCQTIELVLVPQGWRLIGTNNSRAREWERPARRFDVDYVLYISRTEVTLRQYNLVMSGVAVPPEDSRGDEPFLGRWEECKAFCDAFEKVLEQETGRKWKCRLPYEAEWEYAACYGRPPEEDWWPEHLAHPDAENLAENEWFWGNDRGGPQPVAQKRPNKLGLYDMLGNVEEACDGWLTPSVDEMLHDGWRENYRAPTDNYWSWGLPAGTRFRPIRGGGFNSPDDECRPSRRKGWGSHDTSVGIRLVAIPEPA